MIEYGRRQVQGKLPVLFVKEVLPFNPFLNVATRSL